jgi:uncharacterized repeat protein (TIGR01451 family)
MRQTLWPSSLAISTRRTLLSVLLAGVAVSSHAFTIPGPGDRITNIASGDFVDAFGNVQVINSNPVELTITEVRALQLIRDQQQLGLIGGQINFPHTLSNTGNVADSYQLSISQNAGDDFDLAGLAVYADRNQDGLPDDNLNLLVNGNTISLNAGESLQLVATGSIPSDRTNGNTAVFNLTATSTAPTTPPSSTVTDTTTVTTGAVIGVVKSQSVSVGARGTLITYTLTYTNTGNDTGELRITDLLNESELAYITGSGRFSNGTGALTEAAGEAPANSAVDYQVTDIGDQQQLDVVIANIPAQSTGSISFQVQAIGAPDNTIDNTANYRQYNGGLLVKNTNTNTVVFTLQQQAGVVLNITSATASNAGNPASAPDNLQTIASMDAGSEVLFSNYVWNTGENTDVFNLTYTSNNLPSCASVRLYAEDGVTLLTDSNSDGIIDSGAIAADGVRAIKVGVRSTPECATATPITIDVTATSVNNPTVSDPVRNQLDAIVQGATDLYNLDNSGKQPQGVDNAGAAFVSRTIDNTNKVVFPLIVENTNPTVNNYMLIADDDGTLDPLNNTSDLPAGWSVEFFEAASNDCTSLGAAITNSGIVAPNGTVNYCAVVTTPSGAAPSTTPLWFAVRSPVNAQTDLLKNQVIIPTQRLLTLTSDQEGQVSVGGTNVYLHTLTNSGNVTEGVNVGDLGISLDQTSANGFTHTVYFDANNDGLLDAADPIVTDIASLGVTNGAIGLDPNESIRLLVKVQAPAQAQDGRSGSVVLSATPTTLIAGISLAAVTNTDLTRVAASQLRLQKLQALDADCSGAPDTPFSVDPVHIKPNQCVFYQIIATNQSSQPATNVVVNDVVPAYTELNVPPLPSVSQGRIGAGSANTDGATGPIVGELDTIAPNSSASLQFSIHVQP